MLKVRRSTELIALAALTLAFIACGRLFIGIDRADETIYLLNGNILQRHSFLAHQSWAPLYSLWYKLVGILAPNFLARYYLSWSLLVAILAMLPPLLRVRRAWMYTVFLLALPFLLINPYVSIFAATILLAGMCFLLKRGTASFSDACFLACTLSFVTAFARPEYGYGVYISTLAVLVALVLERVRPDPNPSKSARISTIALKVAAVFLMAAVTHFVQVRSASDNRSGLAFQQHFNLRALESGKLRGASNPYLSHYAQQAFGLERDQPISPVTIPIEAYFRANPRLFLNHIVTNFFDPRTIFFLLVLGVVVLRPWLVNADRGLRPASVYLLLCTIPIIAGIVIVYPRDPYPVVVLPALMIFSLQWLKPERWIVGRPTWAVAATVGILFLCCLQVTRLRLLQGPFRDQEDIADRLECVRALVPSISGPVLTVVDPSIDLTTYLPGVRNLPLPETLTDWPATTTWTATNRPAIVVTDGSLEDRLKVSPAVIGESLSQLGYAPHPCPAVPYLVVYTRPNP